MTATAINNKRTVAGIFTDSHNNTNAFMLTRNGTLTVISVPGADMTQAFGINDHNEVVGAYTIGSNTYGFTWTPGDHIVTVNDRTASAPRCSTASTTLVTWSASTPTATTAWTVCSPSRSTRL